MSIPPLWCPIEPRVSPYLAAVKGESLPWVRASCLGSTPERLDRSLATESVEWCARLAPNATHHGLRLMSDMFHAIYAVDDEVVDRPGITFPELVSGAHRVSWCADNPEAGTGESDLFALVQDVSLRILEHSGADLHRRWSSGFSTWLRAAGSLHGTRATGATTSLDDFMIMGPADRAADFILASIEIAEGTSLPEAERSRIGLRVAVQAAGVIMTIDHDLFGYQRESSDGTDSTNVVAAVLNEGAASIQDAILVSVGLRDRVMELYLKVKEKELVSASPEVRTLFGQLDCMIRGTLDWAAVVRRNRTGTGRSGGAIADRPTGDSSSLPAELPSISWWWRLA
ncbi:hypothetical protein GA0115245_11905 [Streptomyces sp. di188]|nr:hypothetical protein GA0115238_12705 [Streptomyces sp. di50b]SCE03935.1 hypothetical protein GA0115245_11905 [Streptomyces sp. di188]